MYLLVKFRYSEKSMKIWKKTSPFAMTLLFNLQKRWEIFFKFCGLLPIYRLYLNIKTWWNETSRIYCWKDTIFNTIYFPVTKIKHSAYSLSILNDWFLKDYQKQKNCLVLLTKFTFSTRCKFHFVWILDRNLTEFQTSNFWR